MPTDMPTPEDSIAILNHATSMTTADTMTVEIEYNIFTDEPVVGKVRFPTLSLVFTPEAKRLLFSRFVNV